MLSSQKLISKQLRENVIRPVLMDIGLYSESAEELLVLTASTESQFKYLRQVNGPALGIYQIEPATHDDVWNNFLDFNHSLAAKVSRYSVSRSSEELVWNLAYSTIIARLVYYRHPDPLPPKDDPRKLAEYWKKVYNTHLGKGTVQKALIDYNRYGHGRDS